MKIKIGNHEFNLILENNETTKALTNMLPLDVEMEELNGNEKYHYLSQSLPSHAQRIGQIRVGDVMLYQDSCLVIFYKAFPTSYSYTKIGHIENSAELEKVVGKGNVKVRWYV